MAALTTASAALTTVSYLRLASDRSMETKRISVVTAVVEPTAHEELMGATETTETHMTIGLGSTVELAGPGLYRVTRRAGWAPQMWTAVGRCEISGQTVIQRALACG